MSGPWRLDRRTFLAATLAGAAVTRCDSPGRPPARHRHTDRPTKEHAIFDLSFETETRYRPFELISPGFVSVRKRPRAVDLETSTESPEAPFCCVEGRVSRPTGAVVLGLATEDGEHLLGRFDPATGSLAVEVRRSGRTKTLRRRRLDLPDEFSMAFALCENRVTLLADTGSGWRPYLTERRKVSAAVDMRVPEVLAAHRYAWGVRGGSGERGLKSVRAGIFGMTGIRDQHVVQHADGTPLVRDGKLYLTATCAGLGFFQQAHWGVFTLDLARPTRMEQVAHLFTHRDGLLLGDHAGQLVRDDENDQWLVATSSWGDFDFDGLHVRHLTTSDDILSGVHVLDTERTPLPTRHSSWDPGITRIDGRWHVSFVESPSQDPFDFHPALAVGPPGAEWHEKLELVGAATSLHQCEGPIIARVQDDWWFLASDGDARNYPVFDMHMRRVGRLDAPYGTNIPHPQLVQLDSGDYLLVTFDGTQYAEDVMGYGGHGDVLIMRSA
jgi:hypothetical protein